MTSSGVSLSNRVLFENRTMEGVMAKLRYIVAMVRRDDPIKPGHPPKDHIRSEFPVERLIAFLKNNLHLPEKTGFLKSKKYTREEVDEAVNFALTAGVSKAYSWLVNNRFEEEKPID